MRLTAWMAAAIVSTVTAGSGRQPDLSGGWMAVRDAPPGIEAAPGAVFGNRFWLEQSGEQFTVIRPVRDSAVVATHIIGGPDVRSRVPGAACFGDSYTITAVAREGRDLVHRTSGTIPAGSTGVRPLAIRHVFRLTAPDTLVVQSVLRRSGQADPVPVATVYKRMSEPRPAVPASPAGTPARLSRLAWLSGVWQGVQGTATLEEHWTPAEGGAMLATSRTVRGGSMSEFEFLCIAERGGGLVYSAMPNGRTPATDFMLTAIDDTSATFENPSHDFPKVIRYALLPDGTLQAIIGDGAARRTTFTFRRQ